MAEFLTQEEIDALLEIADEDEVKEKEVEVSNHFVFKDKEMKKLNKIFKDLKFGFFDKTKLITIEAVTFEGYLKLLPDVAYVSSELTLNNKTKFAICIDTPIGNKILSKIKGCYGISNDYLNFDCYSKIDLMILQKFLKKDILNLLPPKPFDLESNTNHISSFSSDLNTFNYSKDVFFVAYEIEGEVGSISFCFDSKLFNDYLIKGKICLSNKIIKIESLNEIQRDFILNYGNIEDVSILIGEFEICLAKVILKEIKELDARRFSLIKNSLEKNNKVEKYVKKIIYKEFMELK